MASKQRPRSSDSSSSSESEEEQVLQRPPPSPKNASLKSKSLQKPSYDDEKDEDGESPVSQKKDQKKKEVSVKKDEKKNEEEEEGSSDEEDEKQQQQENEDDDNDEGTGTRDEEKQQLSKKPVSMAISASGSDSDSEPEPSEKPAAAGIVTPATSGKKRQRDSAPSEPENTEKKKPFMRIWEVDDEIKILKAIIAFYSDKGPEFPFNTVSLDAIHSLLKKSLGLEFTKSQLGRKIRGLRMKFQANASQRKNNTDLKFSNPQQQEIYELSKNIWSDNPNPNEARKSSGKSVKSKGKSTLQVLKDQEEVDIPEGDPRYELIWRAVAQAGHGDISLSLLKRGLNLVDPEKARLLERRFFKLELARMRLRLKWLDKKKEAIRLVIDSLEKSG